MTDDETASSTGRSRRVKVARIIDESDLEGMGETLIEQWTAPADERESLRELADRFNRQVLRAALESADGRASKTELDTYLSVLTGEDAGTGERIDVERELEWRGIDVESLASDFVTHQAIHTYLTDYRGVTLEESSPVDQIASNKDTIDRLQGRVSAVTESVIEQLTAAGRLSIGNFRVFTRVEVYCSDCETQFQIGELLSDGGCHCETGKG